MILLAQSSVSLTVEGGISLVGPHCPGTVRLFCEGVELTSLRWRYNQNMAIISYLPDSTAPSETLPAQSAFLLVNLMKVTPKPNDPTLANFSSSLTINISQLQLHNGIIEISCGDPGISQVLPVNVSIIEPSVPSSPAISKVTAAYQSGELNSVIVTWMKSVSTGGIYEFCIT